jgi:hypothetical protein
MVTILNRQSAIVMPQKPLGVWQGVPWGLAGGAAGGRWDGARGEKAPAKTQCARKSVMDGREQEMQGMHLRGMYLGVGRPLRYPWLGWLPGEQDGVARP